MGVTLLSRLLSFSLLALGLATSLPAQPEVPPVTRDAINRGLFHPSSSVMLYGTKNRPPQLLGNSYLDTAFHPATLYFFPEVLAHFSLPADAPISGYALRLNLYQQVLELQDADTTKIISSRAVQRIALIRPHDTIFLVNAASFGLNTADYPGFFELLVDGPRLVLLKHTSVVLQAPNYVIALDVGNRNATLVPQIHYYWYEPATARLLPAKLKRKAVLRLLRPHGKQLEQFAKAHRLSWRKASDLKLILQYYHSLPATVRL